MKHLLLDCENRTIIGNGLKKIRRLGLVPAVIYGKTTEPLVVQLQLGVFLKLFKEAGKTTVLDLKLDQTSIPCLIQKIDTDPVSGKVRHIDFLKVNLSEKVETEVPINFINEPDKASGGVLVKQLNTVEIEALPEKIPHSLEVDLSLLKQIGDSIFLKDLTSTADFSFITEPDTLIATLVAEEEEPEPTEIVPEEIPTATDSAKTDETANPKNPA